MVLSDQTEHDINEFFPIATKITIKIRFISIMNIILWSLFLVVFIITATVFLS